MRPVNLFLTEDGVLKMGYYGLFTQAECYDIKGTNCDGIRSFAPEVFRGGRLVLLCLKCWELLHSLSMGPTACR